MITRRNALKAAALLTPPLFAPALSLARGGRNPARYQIGPFHRPSNHQPIIRPDRQAVFRDPITHRLVHWQYTHTLNPAAIAWKDKLYVLFRAEDESGHGIGQYCSRVGLAVSDDGIHFTERPHPVLFPQPGRWEKYEWPGGCEDPRLVQRDDGEFILTYTMWNHHLARLGVATSRDLVHWTHRGPAFLTADHGRFLNFWSKSGAIVTRRIGNEVHAVKIRGRYWMYWHTRGQIYLASSPDLISWTPALDHRGKLLCVLPKNRPGYFDSWLTEPGPPALLTDQGIVFFYNGMSDGRIHHGPQIPAHRYSAGQALFAADDPAHLLHRPEEPYFWPELPWEKTGQYKAGTTFTEGLAWFKNRWFLFYGGADTVVGMAST
jgi:predicted GH43/DUF377 family glycosyl hydrolase